MRRTAYAPILLLALTGCDRTETLAASSADEIIHIQCVSGGVKSFDGFVEGSVEKRGNRYRFVDAATQNKRDIEGTCNLNFVQDNRQ